MKMPNQGEPSSPRQPPRRSNTPHPRPHAPSRPHITEVVAQRYEAPPEYPEGHECQQQQKQQQQDDEDYEASMASWEAPQFDRVYWMREPHLRKLYAWACVLMIASATTGFDA